MRKFYVILPIIILSTSLYASDVSGISLDFGCAYHCNSDTYQTGMENPDQWHIAGGMTFRLYRLILKGLVVPVSGEQPEWHISMLPGCAIKLSDVADIAVGFGPGFCFVDEGAGWGAQYATGEVEYNPCIRDLVMKSHLVWRAGLVTRIGDFRFDCSYYNPLDFSSEDVSGELQDWFSSTGYLFFTACFDLF